MAVDFHLVPGELLGKLTHHVTKLLENLRSAIEAGHLAEARELCEQIAERHRDDEESCMRAGDFGQATKAERRKLAWLERAREI